MTAVCCNKNDGQRIAIKVKEATKQGYAEAHPGDSINLAVPDSKTRRGRVGGAMRTNTRHKLQSRSDGSDQGEYP